MSVPTTLTLTNVEELIHAVYETSVCERPGAATTTKLATALRRLDPERESYAWEELEKIKGGEL